MGEHSFTSACGSHFGQEQGGIIWQMIRSMSTPSLQQPSQHTTTLYVLRNESPPPGLSRLNEVLRVSQSFSVAWRGVAVWDGDAHTSLQHTTPEHGTTMLSRIATTPKTIVSTLRRSTPVVSATRSYHENIVEHYENPRNVGSMNKDDENVGTVSFLVAAFVKESLLYT